MSNMPPPRAVHGEQQAGIRRAAVRQDGAGAAVAHVADLLGAGQMQVVAEHIQQGAPRFQHECMVGPIDAQGDVLVNGCHDRLLHLRYSVASVFRCWRLGLALARLQLQRTLRPITEIHILTCHCRAPHAGLAVSDARRAKPSIRSTLKTGSATRRNGMHTVADEPMGIDRRERLLHRVL